MNHAPLETRHHSFICLRANMAASVKRGQEFLPIRTVSIPSPQLSLVRRKFSHCCQTFPMLSSGTGTAAYQDCPNFCSCSPFWYGILLPHSSQHLESELSQLPMVAAWGLLLPFNHTEHQAEVGLTHAQHIGRLSRRFVKEGSKKRGNSHLPSLYYLKDIRKVYNWQ